MNNNFSTYDLELATVLVTLNYKLIKLDRTTPQRVRFIFEKNEEIEWVMIKYLNDKLKLPAKKLFNNQKMLKTHIYSKD